MREIWPGDQPFARIEAQMTEVIRVLNEHTGELIRALTLDPVRDYQPQNHTAA